MCQQNRTIEIGVQQKKMVKRTHKITFQTLPRLTFFKTFLKILITKTNFNPEGMCSFSYWNDTKFCSVFRCGKNLCVKCGCKSQNSVYASSSGQAQASKKQMCLVYCQYAEKKKELLYKRLNSLEFNHVDGLIILHCWRAKELYCTAMAGKNSS